MRVFQIFMWCSIMLCLNTQAQTLGSFDPKTEDAGMNKLKKNNPEKVYISNFSVHYQVYNEKQKFKKGGSMMGGGVKGDAMAEVAVGLKGIDEAILQDVTNKLYAEYIAKLKAGGMTIITAADAAKTSTYEDYEMVTGGTVSVAEIPGCISTSPTGYEFLIKGVNKKGKTKKGGLLGNEEFIYPKLSKELNDAIISNVNITVLFVKDGQSFQGNGAKVKIKTDLRIVANDVVSMTSEASFKMKGANTATDVSSTVAFYHGKMGLASETTYKGILKKDFEIDGVVDEKKVTSYAHGSMDAVGSSNAYATFYSAANGKDANTKIIPVDGKLYGKGVYEAASKFMNHHVDGFLNDL